MCAVISRLSKCVIELFVQSFDTSWKSYECGLSWYVKISSVYWMYQVCILQTFFEKVERKETKFCNFLKGVNVPHDSCCTSRRAFRSQVRSTAPSINAHCTFIWVRLHHHEDVHYVDKRSIAKFLIRVRTPGMRIMRGVRGGGGWVGSFH